MLLILVSFHPKNFPHITYTMEENSDLQELEVQLMALK